MKIDGYKAEIEHGEIVYYAIAGKKRIRMPNAFKDMYTDDYLEIEEVRYERPELFDLQDHVCYVPRRTS